MSAPIPSRAEFRSRLAPVDAVDTELLFIPVFGPDDGLSDCPGIDAAVGGEWTRATNRGAFGGKPYARLFARVVTSLRAGHVCFIGVGERADLDSVRWRRVSAACGYIARERRVSRCAWLVREGLDVRLCCRGGRRWAVARRVRRRALPHRLGREVLVPSRRRDRRRAGTDEAALAAAVGRGRVVGEAVNVARTFVNEPANVLTPSTFASRTAALATSVGLAVEVLDEARIRELRMGLLLGVARGSEEPPRVLVLRHTPAKAPDTITLGLVGKGSRSTPAASRSSRPRTWTR
jgi:leucyl aminopeptidase